MRSIRRWLLGWLIFGLAVAALAAGAGIFHSAKHEASELFDYELRVVAISLPSNLAAGSTNRSGGPAFGNIGDERIVIGIWDAAGQLVYRSSSAPALARYPEGLRTVEHAEHHWRVFGVQQPGRFVQVAQPIDVREDLALRLALRTLWPLGVLIPPTIALVLFAVARGLAPIGRLSRALATRSIDSLQPLQLDGRDVPVEIRPLVEAVNDLLHRLNVALQAQRTFVADAAHELRSPLTALKLQLQGAVRDGTLKGDAATIERVEGRLNRIIHLVHQLLTLAREDAQQQAPMKAVSLRRLCEQTVGDFSLLAEVKSIDLGLVVSRNGAAADDDACMALAEPNSLGVLLSNLVDNAIRYTPPGGRVDVMLTRDGGKLTLEVADTGPGIPESERGRVLDRFYRGEHAMGQGSGLGLAIVSRIAGRHHATLSLGNVSPQGGLSVKLSGLRAVEPVTTT